MTERKRLTQNEKHLIRRYLIWCYKTTKEELDKVDRYFTQLKVDDLVLRQLRSVKEYKLSVGSKSYKDMVDRFQEYMSKKESNVLKKKYANDEHSVLNPDYQYLHYRFKAIEKAIIRFLGKDELKRICSLYENEMTRRILEARQHD